MLEQPARSVNEQAPKTLNVCASKSRGMAAAFAATPPRLLPLLNPTTHAPCQPKTQTHSAPSTTLLTCSR